ncbi:MAG: EscU/YscU/HrcU family type III secretion system export apparatus switch protein [Chloroflexota bacterium]
MSGERTEAPTQRRLEEARRKGQGVGRSQELTQVMTLVAGLLTLSALLPAAGGKISGIIVDEVDALAQGPQTPIALLLGEVSRSISLVVGIVLPLAGAVMLAGIVGSIAGGGLVLSVGRSASTARGSTPSRGSGASWTRPP